MSAEDTIVAIATPPGRGGIAVIRVSGNLALHTAKVLCNLTPEPRKAYFRKFMLNNQQIDEGVVLYFKAPNSYTGEDVVEYQGHGGNVAPQRVLNALLSIEGIRLAEPGEYTKRAFLNNKMDLTAAEGVEDLISAGSDSAAKAALASIDGVFARHLEVLTEQLTNFRVRLEACLDFPEEHEDFFDSGKAADELLTLKNTAEKALSIAFQGVKLNEGARIVLAGSPNAGKSSLLNALAGVEKAIVTNIPGTTRDVLNAEIEISGVPVNITDTAGIRDTPQDEIEAIGIKKAIAELKKADLVLFMVDGSNTAPDALETLQKIHQYEPDNKNILVIVSKADLEQNADTMKLLDNGEFKDIQKIHTSTKTEDGLDNLKNALTKALGIMPVEGVFSARRRHTANLKETIRSLDNALGILNTGDIVLCAQELMEAQNHLGTITGKVTSDDILGKIFSTFCIGK